MKLQDRQTNVIASGSVTAMIAGALLAYTLTSAFAFGAPRLDSTTNGAADLQLAMRWVQPILGRGIVEDSLNKHQQRRMEAGIRVINGPAEIAYLPYSATALEADHAALVQWVVGRLIVELTRHRMGAGELAVDRLGEESNQRIIAIARQTVQQFHETFPTAWQIKPGRPIATGAITEGRTMERDPEEVGLIF